MQNVSAPYERRILAWSATSSTITSVSSNNNIRMNTPTTTRNTVDTGHFQSVIVQENHLLPPEIDVPHILSTITGNRNQPNVARIIDSRTESGRNSPPPVVFVTLEEGNESNNNRNNAATTIINDQRDYYPIRRSHQHHVRAMLADRHSDYHGRADRAARLPTGFYQCEADRRWIHQNSPAIPSHRHDADTMGEQDMEIGTNRPGSLRFSGRGRRSRPATNKPMWNDDDDEDYYYSHHKYMYDISRANHDRLSMVHDHHMKKKKQDRKKSFTCS
jgi:hypothetical protein